MLFTSPVFIKFVAVVFAVYYIPQLKYFQIHIIIIASILFYMKSTPDFAFLLMFSILASSATSHAVATSKSMAKVYGYTVIGVTANILLLSFFKYKSLFIPQIYTDPTLHAMTSFALALPLPVGISFYTFHGISLIVDTYRSRNQNNSYIQNIDKGFFDHLKKTFLYLIFFPQLIAGPIMRARDFYPQIRTKEFADINWNGAIRALIIGYFLKRFVGDNISAYTSIIKYPYFMDYSTINLSALLIAYSIQIFADFAGYSMIALGLGRLFGYELPINFMLPYISETFSEFWRRWHISLSSWLREYLYVPLGGSRSGRARTYTNLIIVMILGGLWHGAAWSYAAWGLWHGCALVIERLLIGTWFYRQKGPAIRAARITLVFCVVSFGWLLFKLPDFNHVVQFITAMLRNYDVEFLWQTPFMVALYTFPIAAYHARGLILANSKSERTTNIILALDRPILGFILALTLISSGDPNAFIYFQF